MSCSKDGRDTQKKSHMVSTDYHVTQKHVFENSILSTNNKKVQFILRSSNDWQKVDDTMKETTYTIYVHEV